MYKNGVKCWNGFNWSVIVDFFCGIFNVFILVFEFEKCEYRFKVISFVFCWLDVLDSLVDEVKVKEEF